MNQFGIIISILFVAPFLSGCVTDVDGDSDDPSPPLMTPESAQTRSDEQRRQSVISPGDPRFAGVDAAVAAALETGTPTGALLAVMVNGQLKYESGYGHFDERQLIDMPHDAIHRGGSFVKPMTAAIIDILVNEGKLQWSDPAVCVRDALKANCHINLEPQASRPILDNRLADITLADLRDHYTGWTVEQCQKPDLNTVEIASQFGIASPTPSDELIRWMLGEELTFDPGSDNGEYAYCNIGYVMLGYVAEHSTGHSLPELYRAFIIEPLDLVGEMELGRTLPADRNVREPYYQCEFGMTKSVYPPHEQVCWPDGGLSVENLWAAGGMAATAAAFAAFFEAYDSKGHPRQNHGEFSLGDSSNPPGMTDTKGGDFPGMTGLMTQIVTPSEDVIHLTVIFNSGFHQEPLTPGQSAHKHDAIVSEVVLASQELDQTKNN